MPLSVVLGACEFADMVVLSHGSRKLELEDVERILNECDVKTDIKVLKCLDLDIVSSARSELGAHNLYELDEVRLSDATNVGNANVIT